MEVFSCDDCAHCSVIFLILLHLCGHDAVTFRDMAAHVDDDNQASLSYAQINTFFECKDGVSIGFITIVVLGILTMWYILFTKITMGRRKRSITNTTDDTFDDVINFIKAAILSGRYMGNSLCQLYHYVMILKDLSSKTNLRESLGFCGSSKDKFY